MTSPTRSVTIHARTTADGRGLLELRQDLDKAAKGADKLDERLKRIGGDDDRLSGVGRALRKQTTHGMLDGIGDAFAAIPSRLRGIGISALIGFAAAAAPTLGAMIAGAVTGAVGLGGIAGGIAAASNSPAVRQAAKNLGSNIASSFTQMGDQFVEPLLQAFEILQQGWYNLNLEAAFEKVAAYVDDIAIGISGFAKGIVDGFSNALGNAGPILSLMRTELPRLGDAIGYMLDRMSQGRGVVEGFVFFMRTLDAIIIGTGNTIGWLADRFHEFIALEAKIFGWLEDIPQAQKFFGEFNNRLENLISVGSETGQTMNYIGRETQLTAGAVQATTDAIRKLTDAMFDNYNAQLAQSNANLAQAENWHRLRESVKDAGTSLNRHTEAGLNNHRMINSLVGGVMAIRDANIKAGMATDEANRKYQSQVTQLQRVLIQMGFNEAQIADLVGEYKKIPTRITTQIVTEYQTRGKPPGEHSGIRIGESYGRQHGGPVFPGVPYMINEAGRETVTFPAAGQVHPANLTPMAGGKSYTINVNVAAGANLREAGRVTVEAIQSYERANGAGWRN